MAKHSTPTDTGGRTNKGSGGLKGQHLPRKRPKNKGKMEVEGRLKVLTHLLGGRTESDTNRGDDENGGDIA